MSKKRLYTLLYCFLIVAAFEFLLVCNTIGKPDVRFFNILLLSIPAAGFLYILTSLFTPKVNKIIFNAFILIIAIYFCVQTVYFTIFGEFMSISLLKMGTDATENFKDQIFTGISDSLFPILSYLALFAISVFLTVKKFISFEPFELKRSLINITAVIALHFLCPLILGIAGTGAYTPYDIYHSNDSTTQISVENLGLLTTTKLESKHLIFKDLYISDAKNTISELEKVKNYSKNDYNVTDIDFNEILKRCNSLEAAELTAELAKREPTNKNEYTGLFEDCNLITICAESFSPYLIDKERTPTLYKLANEGFIFKNFYASYESVTTNGEYSYCLGLFPDMSRSKSDNSFMASGNNSLPYALGNMFSGIGGKTYAYHNFLGTYYSRNVTHPNMGYDIFKTPDNGLDIAPTWPSSDYDMMVQSVDDYIDSGEQFHTYYMTFSGHYQYDWKNIMCIRNKSQVKDLDYPLAVKAYLSSNMELEKALTYLMKRLKEAGIEDNTVIVLTTDHYPYGLDEYEYNRMAGKEIDTEFEKYKNSFICWKGGMEEPIIINDICSTIDILPTLLNLFGFEYDSRLIMGKDVLSNADEIAILANQSFITSDYKFNAATNSLTSTNGKEVDSGLAENTKEYVKNTFSLSREILNTNYYQYIMEAKNG